MERIYTTPGNHPYDDVIWEKRDIEIKNWRDGSVNFKQEGAEFPDFWSVNAANIVASKYFRRSADKTERGEHSLRDLIDRVVAVYKRTGVDNGYFLTSEDANIFEEELTYLLLHQVFSFNSPVWFNVGTESPQQVSACFLLSVDDTMDSILDWYKEEGMIFKGGSGSGVNLSRIRGKNELLTSGGTASGPVSFMRGADASAGTIKSGGATRRAAKMVQLDIDHPDIEEFIETKVREEKKIRALRDAGFDMDLGGEDIYSVQYQNANNSVRVSDKFMRQVTSKADTLDLFDLHARVTGEVMETVSAKRIWGKMAQAAWECADPGVQYDDTINAWHTCPTSGRITTSNPCGEYVHLDNSSCNLASINLMKFLDGNNVFDTKNFVKVCELIITAMDISICFADFPTEKIANTSRNYRQLGLGYANLGSLLMASGIPYDSKEGRNLAAAITSLMTGAAYRKSASLAGLVGPYAGYAINADDHKRVVLKHAKATQAFADTTMYSDIWDAAVGAWKTAISVGAVYGYRNAQTTLLAPTGTIGLMMDCDTTGIEPALGLQTYKKLVGGGSMVFVNSTVRHALLTLGYKDYMLEEIIEHILNTGSVINAPGLSANHYPVFDCALGDRSIKPAGHIQMMAAVQPFLSGAISKTVNMPASSTVEDVQNIYYMGWKLGLKSLAIYRDNCKVGQPLSTSTKQLQTEELYKPTRKRLPKKRPATVTKFDVAGADGYMTASTYPDDGLGEVFLKLGKQGSTLAGLMDAFSIAISVGLQYGIPLETFVAKFMNMRFEPAGITDDPDIRISLSIIDYMFRRLAIDHMSYDQRAELGILSVDERNRTGQPEITVQTYSAPLCLTCGTEMRPAGSCYVCEGCGSTSGCS